jgi:hypothetical protein
MGEHAPALCRISAPNNSALYRNHPITVRLKLPKLAAYKDAMIQRAQRLRFPTSISIAAFGELAQIDKLATGRRHEQQRPPGEPGHRAPAGADMGPTLLELRAALTISLVAYGQLRGEFIEKQ